MSGSTLPVASTGDGALLASEAMRGIPLIPRNLALSVLHAYRAVISPLYGDVCKYYPSCSAYSVGAIQQHGVLKGSAMTAVRLARCHPWAQGGIDDVTPHAHFRHDLTPHGFVVPSRKD